MDGTHTLRLRTALLRALCILSSALSAFSFWLSAQSPDILHLVDEHYNHLHSLRAHYTERYTGMGLDRSESGTLTLLKPGRMRWAYDSPAGKVFLLDGKFAWFYTPGDPQAQRISAKQMDDLRTPLRLLLGHTQLRKELEGVTVTPDADGYRIAGVPKGLENRVKLLSLQVHPDGRITEMKVEEVDGATTEFSFAGIEENVPSNPAEFTFTPPPGVTVIEGTQPI